MDRHPTPLETGLGGTLVFMHLLMQPGPAPAQEIGRAITLSINATILDSVSISGDGEVVGGDPSEEAVSREEIIVVY